jgi:hypothetical protein
MSYPVGSGYAFGTGVSDIIDMGTGVTHASMFSLAVRFAFADSNNTEGRLLAAYHDGIAAQNVNLFTQTGAGNEKIAFLFSTGAGSGFANLIAWEPGGLTPESIHIVVATYDGATMKIYGDTDATPKATRSTTDTPDQGGTQHFTVGNQVGGTASAHAAIYEVGWWAGLALTGGQAATLGARLATGVPVPTHYWGFKGNANDLFGGQHGTVTGARSLSPWFPAA